MKMFYESYSLKSFVNQPACSKNPGGPTCIDLNVRSFQMHVFSNRDRVFRCSFDDIDCYEKIKF